MTKLTRFVAVFLSFALGCGVAAVTGEPLLRAQQAFMSTQENGIASNIALSGTIGITSSTAANPTVIYTGATPHGMTTGDTVSIRAHQTNTGANGVWTVTAGGIYDAYHFAINADTHLGAAGGNTGTMQSLALGATAAIPSDGDAAAAASVDVALQAWADRTAFLAENLGAWKLATALALTLSDASDGNGTTWDSYTFAADNTYTAPNGVAIWTPGGLYVNPGDLLEVTVDTSASVVGAGTETTQFASFALFQSMNAPGAGPAAATKMQGSAMRAGLNIVVTAGSAGLSFAGPVHCLGRYLNAGSVQVIPTISLRASTGARANLTTFVLTGDYTVNFKVWRPTGMVQ